MPSPTAGPRDAAPAAPAAPAFVVSRSHRALDVLSGVLVVGGGGMFSFAFAGLERMHRTAAPGYTEGMVIEQLARYYRLSALSWSGLGVVAAGIALGVYTWLRHRAAARAAS